MYGKNLMRDYSDYVENVGLCDINPGHVKYAREYIAVNCPIFTDFEKVMRGMKPDTLIVTTVDSTHDEFISRGLELRVNVITEKPMTTDEMKAQDILEAEKKTGKNVIVTFNYATRRIGLASKSCL